MSLIHTLIMQHLPVQRRVTPKGWILHNAVCCSHRGHKADTRMRGNIRVSEDGQIGANCFNCGFKTRFDGAHLTTGFEQYLDWLGVPKSGIQSLKMELLQKQLDGTTQSIAQPRGIYQKFPSVELPENARPIESYLSESTFDPDFLKVVEYLESRGEDIAGGYDYYWSPSLKHQLNNRVVIPFYSHNQIVGWTARYAGSPPQGIPRYFNSSIPDGYLFNNDVLDIPGRKFSILVEGSFDAIAVQGVGALGSTLSEQQIFQLASRDQEIIVLPDRQRKNQDLIDAALMFGWSVSFPEWEDDVKDAAEACKRYGQLYTITSVIQSRTKNDVEIGIKRQLFRG